MGRANDEEARLSDVDGQESLPLYEEAHPYHGGEVVLPAPAASPDQVRDFLVQLLQTRCNIGIDHGRRIAARWTRGTGKELRTYPLSMYKDIFGSMEDTWAVYREVRILQYTKEREEHYIMHHFPRKWNPVTCWVPWLTFHFLATGIGLALSVIVMLTSAWLVYVKLESDFAPLFVMMAFFSGMSSIGFIVAMSIQVSPETRAERELQCSDWTKAPVAGPSGT